MKTEKFISTKTTEDYWDCECKENYIHSKKTVSSCDKCGAYWEDQPDSRIEEVLQMFIGKKIMIVDYYGDDRHLYIIPNRYELECEDNNGEPALWNDEYSQWVSLGYAEKHIVNK